MKDPARRALALLLAVNCLNIYDRQALGALAEPLRHAFALSDMQLGALTTLFTVVYAVVGLPLGRLADTGSRRRLLGAGVAIWTSLTALGSLATGYGWLVASRLGVAVGEAVCAPTATSWIGDLFPPERRTRALAVFMFGVPLGIALSFIIGGPAAQAWGWRTAMLLAAVPALVLVPAVLRLPEPPRTAAGPASRGAIFRQPAFRWIVVSGALLNAALYSFSVFLSAFLTRWHGLSIGMAGVWAGLGSGAAGIAGGLLAGAWGDRRPRTRLRTAALASLAAAPAATAGILLPAGKAWGAMILLMAAYGLLSMYYGLVYAAIQDIVPPHRRGAAMALYFMVMYLCGASFGPLATGRLSDVLARRAAAAGLASEAAKAAGLRGAMLSVPALALLLAAVLWAGSRSYSRTAGKS